MLRKSLLILSASAMLGLAGSVQYTSPAHAFGPPPPFGGGFHPPALGGLPHLGGIPHFAGPRLGGAPHFAGPRPGFGGAPRVAGINRFGGEARFNRIRGNFNGARANLYNFRGSSARSNVAVYNNYSSSGSRGWRGRHWGRYGGVYAYGSDSSSSSSSGCYYAERYSSKYGTYRRVLVCR
jgi:hypothetical protein